MNSPSDKNMSNKITLRIHIKLNLVYKLRKKRKEGKITAIKKKNKWLLTKIENSIRIWRILQEIIF